MRSLNAPAMVVSFSPKYLLFIFGPQKFSGIFYFTDLIFERSGRLEKAKKTAVDVFTMSSYE